MSKYVKLKGFKNVEVYYVHPSKDVRSNDSQSHRHIFERVKERSIKLGADWLEFRETADVGMDVRIPVRNIIEVFITDYEYREDRA